eukprot:11376810-Alexandrium_andersonii.AAC.1
MEELHTSCQSEFSGLRDTRRAQMNRTEDLVTGVGGRLQALEDGLAQLTVAAQELKAQAGSSTGKPAYAGAPAPG